MYLSSLFLIFIKPYPYIYTYIYLENSPALKVRSQSAWKHYSVGPPYIVEKTDLLRIAHYWHDFVPRVYEGHPHLLAEMYAYSVAAAHLELPHLRLDGYMTSEADGYGEAWDFVHPLPEESLCTQDLTEQAAPMPVCSSIICLLLLFGNNH